MGKMIDALRPKHFREEKENWQSYDYGKRIKELKRPTTWKWTLIRYYIHLNPLRDYNKEIKKLIEKDRIQDDVIEALEQLEEGMEDYRSALDDYWELKYGKTVAEVKSK